MSSAKAEASVDFVLVFLAREGGAWVHAASSSMAPLIQPGDQLRLGALDPASARPGMIVAFRRDGTLIVHRVLGATPAGLVTKGDALAQRLEIRVAVAQDRVSPRAASVRSPTRQQWR